ncbi:hypothetical protein [Nostoc sp.]|uniref:hypothetical protein n=1 Tax=Nostoc sp. TaxID=1180 RepID=UPI003592E89B
MKIGISQLLWPLLIDGMNFVSRKGAKNQSLALVKNLNSSRIYAMPYYDVRKSHLQGAIALARSLEDV